MRRIGRGFCDNVYLKDFLSLHINFRRNRSAMVFQDSRNARDRALIHARVLGTRLAFTSQRLSLSLSLPNSAVTLFPFRQLSSTLFCLIPDAGTEKLAGVLLISGKTCQVPSRRVAVGG